MQEGDDFIAVLPGSSASIIGGVSSLSSLYPYAVLIVYFPPTNWLADSCVSSFSCLLVNQSALFTLRFIFSPSINALQYPMLNAPCTMLHSTLHAPCSIHNDPP